jgi:hypothetical protein
MSVVHVRGRRHGGQRQAGPVGQRVDLAAGFAVLTAGRALVSQRRHFTDRQTRGRASNASDSDRRDYNLLAGDSRPDSRQGHLEPPHPHEFSAVQRPAAPHRSTRVTANSRYRRQMRMAIGIAVIATVSTCRRSIRARMAFSQASFP